MTETSWRRDLTSWLTKVASSVDDFIDIRWQYFKKRFGWDGIPRIQPYIGYANEERVWLHGRVLTNPPADLPEQDDKWWDNLANMYQRFASNEVPNCEVELKLGDVCHHATTDAEGYFFVEKEYHWPTNSRGHWSTATAQIVGHSRVAANDSTVLCKFFAPPSTADFAVISDVDDTILHTGATRLITMATLTFFGNARTRLPLPGAGALYRALQMTREGSLNPIFYISSSAWNLFDLLEDFLELNDIPLGPLLLRDLGFDDNKFLKVGHEHKLHKTRSLLAAYPRLPFLLIGDSGQEDAQLYASAAEEFGDRIKLILIRDVDPYQSTNRDTVVRSAIERARAVGVPMYLVRDSQEAAEWAISTGLLDAAALSPIGEAVGREYRRDESRFGGSSEGTDD